MDIWGSFNKFDLGLARTIFCSGACASGIALGLGLFRQWAWKMEDEESEQP